VAKTEIIVDGVTVKVTISIGIAQMTDAHGDWSALLKDADDALYAAKVAGRDCVK
jgi:diguanylate cyclase (GGDEF)-like protein